MPITLIELEVVATFTLDFQLLLLVKHETNVDISAIKIKREGICSMKYCLSDYCRIFRDLGNEFDLVNVVDVKPLSFGCIDGQNHL